MDEIIKDIIGSYNSLWRTKVHGNSIELITPISTTNNIFVSVFLTKRQDNYVVTDGGWLYNEFYETSIDIEESEYNRLFTYYLEYYNIKKTIGNGIECYYKKTDKAILVPNIVYDLSNFISAVVSATFIGFRDIKEQEDLKRFTTKAKNFLKSIADDVDFNSSIHESIKAVKFGAVIKNTNRITLVNFVSGTNTSNFINSACKSNTNFEIADSSPMAEFIHRKISIINNQAEGYNEQKVARYITLLELKHKTKPINWTERELVKNLLYK